MKKGQLIKFLFSMQEKQAEITVTFIGGDKYRLKSLDIYRKDEVSVMFEDSMTEVPHDYVRSQVFREIADLFNSQTIEITQGKREWYSPEAELPIGFVWTSNFPSEAIGMVYSNEDILEICSTETEKVLYKKMDCNS